MTRRRGADDPATERPGERPPPAGGGEGRPQSGGESRPRHPAAERMVIREARRDDLPALVRLLSADVVRPDGSLTGPGKLTAGHLAAYDDIEADPSALLVVGELDGDVVATCQLNVLRYLIREGGLIAQVEAVRTAEHLRGQGIGTALLTWVIDESRRRGAVRLQLTSNVQRTAAHRFYERLGFVPTHIGMKLYLT